eukprot:631730-Rhodomonas_salina.1
MSASSHTRPGARTDRQLGPGRQPDQRVAAQVEGAEPREVAEADRDVAELIHTQFEAEQGPQRAQATREALDVVVACLGPHPSVSAPASTPSRPRPPTQRLDLEREEPGAALQPCRKLCQPVRGHVERRQATKSAESFRQLLQPTALQAEILQRRQ